MSLKSSWIADDIYPEDFDDEPKVTHAGNFSDGSVYNPNSSTEKVYVAECFFSSFKDRAINYQAHSSGKMLVELSIFINCTSNDLGGCIYQSDGNFVLNKCCGIRCYTKGTINGHRSGQFAYTTLSSDNKNNLLDSSISLSYEDSASYQAALYLLNGNIIVKTMNFSKNKCEYNTAIACYPSSGTCSISFSSINGNEGTKSGGDRIIGFSTKNTQFDLISSNVINNIQQNTTNTGMIYSLGYTNIQNCCILDNDTPYLFHLWNSNSRITITNCTIKEEDLSKVIGGSIQTNGVSWKPNYSFINKIKCTENGEYCQASYDAIGNAGRKNTVKIFHHDTVRILKYTFPLCLFLPN